MDGVFLTSRGPASLAPAGLFAFGGANRLQGCAAIVPAVVDENEQLLAGVHAELGE